MKNIQFPVSVFFKKVTLIDSFVTLEVDDLVAKRLETIINILNNFLKKNGYETYFENPLIHVSVFKLKDGNLTEEIKKEIEAQKVEKVIFSLNELWIKLGIKSCLIKKK